MIVQAQVTINANRAAAWSALTNFQKASEFISGIEKIEMLNTPANGLTGTKWQETRMYYGKPAAVVKSIIEAAENEFYKTKTEMDGYVFLTTMSLSGSNGSVMLTSTHETKALNFMAKLKAIPMIFFKGMIKKTIQQDLNDIKKFIEKKQQLSVVG